MPDSVAYREFLKGGAIQPQPNVISGEIYLSGKKKSSLGINPEFHDFYPKKMYSKKDLFQILWFSFLKFSEFCGNIDF